MVERTSESRIIWSQIAITSMFIQMEARRCFIFTLDFATRGSLCHQSDHTF